VSEIDVEVAIVGLGPVGGVTANLLGSHGVRTGVFEREVTAHGQPRAFSCDDEALRIYQRIGLADRILADMRTCTEVCFVGLDGRPFAEIKLADVDFGLGYRPLNFFHQPILEKALRDGLERYPHVQTRLGMELTHLSQKADHVLLTFQDANSRETHEVRARYVLGCDGARSKVRSLSEIPMQGHEYKEPWLAVSIEVPPEAFRIESSKFYFFCDPRRPHIAAQGALDIFRLEFMLLEGETPEEMESPEKVKQLIAPYVDPERVTIARSTVYTFRNSHAAQWKKDRVFLLGDAAHLIPPFMGQGLCSGLRDAANLTWKLAMALRDEASPHVLDTYETERRSHLEEIADVNLKLGHVFLARKPWVAHLRDATLRTVLRVPRARRFVQDFEFKPVPLYEKGLMEGTVHTRLGQGEMFPQPRVRTENGDRLLDEVLGSGFSVVGVGRDGPISPGVWPKVAGRFGTRFIRVLPQGSTLRPNESPATDVVDLEGHLTAWFTKRNVETALLRPDRFVFAAGARVRAYQMAELLGAALHAKP